jgi:hypothetical protein
MNDSNDTLTERVGAGLEQHAAIMVIDHPVPLVVGADEGHRGVVRDVKNGNVLAMPPAEPHPKGSGRFVAVEGGETAPALEKGRVSARRWLAAGSLREEVASGRRIRRDQPVEDSGQGVLLQT